MDQLISSLEGSSFAPALKERQSSPHGPMSWDPGAATCAKPAEGGQCLSSAPRQNHCQSATLWLHHNPELLEHRGLARCYVGIDQYSSILSVPFRPPRLISTDTLDPCALSRMLVLPRNNAMASGCDLGNALSTSRKSSRRSRPSSSFSPSTAHRS